MIDVAMLDCQVAILENAIARYSATGEVPGPIGARHPSITPFEAFATADGHIVIAAGNDALFAPPLRDHRPPRAGQPTRASRRTRCAREHNAELKPELEARARARGRRRTGSPRSKRAGIPCGPIQNIAQVLADPQVAARNMVVTADDPDIGPLRMAGNPIKLSAFDDPTTRDTRSRAGREPRGVAPRTGELANKIGPQLRALFLRCD